VKDRISLLTLGCLGCLSVVGIFAAHQLTRLESNLAALIREAANRKETELVTRPSGRVTTATATRGEDESQAEFVARFDALVELLRTTG
jgi:hypothetical protein